MKIQVVKYDKKELFERLRHIDKEVKFENLRKALSNVLDKKK